MINRLSVFGPQRRSRNVCSRAKRGGQRARWPRLHDAQARQTRPMLTQINAADEATKTRLTEVYCMNHPWLTTTDWPVSAFDGNAARNTATSATSCAVVNSPSTVSFNITVLTT